MYSNQSFDEAVATGRSSDDYEFCNTETGQKLIVQWSPQDGTRYLSRNRYAPPRSLSKSVPRRTRSITHYNINRSLNFDIGSRARTDRFKSPKSHREDNSPINGDNYLSRSSKILRALNIDYRPMKGSPHRIRRINKSLNFDLSPSPKRLAGINNSARSVSARKFVSPITKINKTLNFEISSGESSVNSILDSSVESIDENQNQTPSQRNRKAKKSLNYPSPEFLSNSPQYLELNVPSPKLRSELRDKIDDLIQRNMTPYMKSSKRNRSMNTRENFSASTPRNLFNDFHNENDDDDDDENGVEKLDNDRPRTPENVIKIVPESMSAIKKSHKKERVLGRLGKAIAYQAESCSSSKAFTDTAMDPEPEQNRSTTPSTIIPQQDSPQCGPNSIKVSHKKDKIKRKSRSYNSEDEMAETGSIFDYTDEAKAISISDDCSLDENPMDIETSESKDSPHPIKRSRKKDKATRESYSDNSENDMAETGSIFDYTDEARAVSSANDSDIDENPTERKIHELEDICLPEEDKNLNTKSCAKVSPVSVKDPTPSHRFISNIDTERDTDQLEIAQGSCTEVAKESRDPTTENNDVKTLTKTVENPGRPSTPENRINFLQRVMTDSIKKSHKKIKDANKRWLFKPRLVQDDTQVEESRSNNDDTTSTGDQERASTPDNTNSSRLLLPQFSSIKKSHRKDKHRRMVSGSLERQKFYTRDATSNSDCSASSSGDFSSLSPPQILPEAVKRRKTIESLSSSDSNDAHYLSIERSPLDDGTLERGIGALLNCDDRRSSPIKRKNSTDEVILELAENRASSSAGYESAEEEFKIFTPIKKRKSLNLVGSIVRRICDGDNFSPETKLEEGSIENIPTTRCSTPTTPRSGCSRLIANSFKTPEASTSGVTITITDHSSPVLPEIDDPNGGRSTPQNRSTAELIGGINSIKRSHKKDKRGNVSRRAVMCPQAETDETEFTSNIKGDKSKPLLESPRPSTSYEGSIVETENETSGLAKTPPNCLKAMTYMRLLQTESIKKSHKKVRDRRRYRSIVADEELSEDGSIFDETERSLDAGNNEGTSDFGNEKYGNSDENCTLDKSRSEIDRSPRHEDEDIEDAAPSRYNDNLSEDGSIFESEEKLQKP